MRLISSASLFRKTTNIVELLLVLFSLLFVLLTISAYTDLRWGKVYNWVTIPAILVGFGINFLYGGFSGLGDEVSRNYNLLSSFLGMALGIGILGIFFLPGALGGGDVKLAAAIGALMGWQFLFWVLFFGSLIGGMMAIGAAIWKGRFQKILISSIRFLFTLRAQPEVEGEPPLTIPFGLALVGGSFVAFFFLLGQKWFFPVLSTSV